MRGGVPIVIFLSKTVSVDNSLLAVLMRLCVNTVCCVAKLAHEIFFKTKRKISYHQAAM